MSHSFFAIDFIIPQFPWPFNRMEEDFFGRKSAKHFPNLAVLLSVTLEMQNMGLIAGERFAIIGAR